MQETLADVVRITPTLVATLNCGETIELAVAVRNPSGSVEEFALIDAAASRLRSYCAEVVADADTLDAPTIFTRAEAVTEAMLIDWLPAADLTQA